MRTRDFLKKVDEFLTPERFTQGHYAENAWGGSTYCDSPYAVRFCVFGACEKVAGGTTPDYSRATDKLNDVAFDLYGEGAITVNDVHGFATIKHVIKKARQ